MIEEIKERWKLAIEFLDRDAVANERIQPHLVEYTIPAKDIRYLLNRLEAAERAAKGSARMIREMRALMGQGDILPDVKEAYVEHLHKKINKEGVCANT